MSHVNVQIKRQNKRYENEHFVQEFQQLFHHVNVVVLIPKMIKLELFTRDQIFYKLKYFSYCS